MNNFPTFNPNEPLLNQISSNKLNQVSGGQKSNQLQSGVGYRLTQTSGGTSVNIIKRRTPVYVHPWKVTSNGNDSVTVEKGKIFYWSPTGDGKPFEVFYEEFSGIFTVTATGRIYAVTELTDTPVNDYLDTWFQPGTISLEIDPTPTGDNLYIPIADVSLTDGIAAVVEQILFENFHSR